MLTTTELIDRIYKRAEELGISLESLGIYDGEDLQTRSLILFLNSMEDLDYEMVSPESDDELDEEEIELEGL